MRYFIPLILVFLLIGCSSTNESENNIISEGNKTTEDQKDTQENSKDSATFHDVRYLLGIEEVTVTGQAKATNGEVYYEVEQGEETILNEEKIELDHKDEDWTEFEFEFDLTKEMENDEDTLVVALYGKDQTGKKINSNYLPIDFNMQFNKDAGD